MKLHVLTGELSTSISNSCCRHWSVQLAREIHLVKKGPTFGREVCKRNMCNRLGLSSVVNWQRSGTNKWRLGIYRAPHHSPRIDFWYLPIYLVRTNTYSILSRIPNDKRSPNLVQVEFSFEGWCRGYSNHLLVCLTNVCRPICLLLTKVLLLMSYPINPNSAHLIVTWIPNPYLCFQALVSFS